MNLSKIFFISIISALLIAAYSFGYNSGKEDVICEEDCRYWQMEVYDVIYIGKTYQDMYYSCVRGETHSETQSNKDMIDELVSKYRLNEGMAKP